MARPDYILARARFKNGSMCFKCNDVGIVRIKVENLGSLAKCSCDIGGQQGWVLPFVTELTGSDSKPVPFDQFKPPFNPKTQEQLTRFIMEKVAWWKEKIHQAVEYWANNPPAKLDLKPLAPQGEVLRRDPYAD